jgi:kumamolisin
MAEDRVALPGSDRQAAPNAQAIGPTDPDQQIEVTVLVKSRETDSRTTLAAMAGQSPQERKYLSREEFAQTHGAEQADLDQIAVWAESQALTVVETSVARRSVVLSGTVAAFTAAFGVTLTARTHCSGRVWAG